LTKLNINPGASPNAAGRLSFGTDLGKDVVDPWAVDTAGVMYFGPPGATAAADTTLQRTAPGVLTVTGGIATGGGTPILTLGAAAGTSPPAAVLGAGSNDTRGSLTLGTGTGPTTGNLITVTYSAALPAAPIVNLTETTTAASLLSPAVVSSFTTGFTIAVGTAPAASQANTVYGLSWSLAR
jgi:hypothetical protein